MKFPLVSCDSSTLHAHETERRPLPADDGRAQVHAVLGIPRFPGKGVTVTPRFILRAELSCARRLLSTTRGCFPLMNKLLHHRLAQVPKLLQILGRLVFSRITFLSTALHYF